EAQLAPLRKELAQLEAPYRSRLTEAKKARLEPAYRAALAVAAAKRTPEQKKLAEHAQILIKVTWDEVVDALTPADRARRAALREQIHVLEAHKPPPVAHAWSVRDDAKRPATHVLLRGDVKRKGPAVEPGLPRVLCVAAETPPAGRLDLADWLTRPDHP